MPHPSRLAGALVLALVATTAVHAQVRRVQPAPSTAPSASARAATALPSPSGLSPVFPAGVSSGSGAAVSRDRIAAGSAVIGTGVDTSGNINAGTTAIVGPTVIGGSGGLPRPELPPSGVETGMASAYAATQVLGAGAGTGVPGPSQFVPGGSAGYSAVDIARSFILADGNRDGELSRSEARRLSIATQPFETMDRNFDGILTRAEYEDGLR